MGGIFVALALVVVVFYLYISYIHFCNVFFGCLGGIIVALVVVVVVALVVVVFIYHCKMFGAPKSGVFFCFFFVLKKKGDFF